MNDVDGERVCYFADVKKLGQKLSKAAGVVRNGEELNSLLKELQREVEKKIHDCYSKLSDLQCLSVGKFIIRSSIS